MIDSEDLASVADLCTKVLIKEELTSIKQEFSARFFGYRGKSSKTFTPSPTTHSHSHV